MKILKETWMYHMPTQSDNNYLASSFDKINCVQVLVRYANTGKLQNNGEFEW